MTKKELVGKIAETAGTSKKQAEQVVDAMLQTIVDAMQNGDKVQLQGFGTFEAVQKKATKRRNPRTGEEFEVAAHRVPQLKVSSALKGQFK